MSTVEVRLYASLRKYHPNPGSSEALRMELDDKAKLGDLIDKLKIPREELGIIMVNGKWEKESYLPKEGDRIGMFSLVGGG